ncbi:NUDIX hydrolase [Gordonia humi]|uniref:NUDIX hydrolase n=1 Tax=Gordonia humi TaxID=686429 RepID=UPI003607B120
MIRRESGLLVPRDEVPEWLRPVTDDVEVVNEKVLNRGGDRVRMARDFVATRTAAVLVLFGGSFDAAPDHPGGVPADADVLLTERATTLRTHGGQIAFPGGARDPGDEYPVGTAMREAWEETGLAADGVDVLASLPEFPRPVGFRGGPGARALVASVPGPRRRQGGDGARGAREPARVAQRRASVPGESGDSRTRRVPRSGVHVRRHARLGGFTGGLIAAISEAAGWDVPWDTDDVRPLEEMIELAGGRQVSGFAAEPPR